YHVTLRRPPTSPLFPYTTLFRSEPNALGLRLAFHFILDDDLTFGRADRVGHHRLRLGLGLRLRSRLSLESSLPLDDRRVLEARRDRKSTRLNSSHVSISYAVFCL